LQAVRLGLTVTAAALALAGEPAQGGQFPGVGGPSFTLTVTRCTTAGPPAAEVTDALAGRVPVAAVLGDLPADSRAALSGWGDFFNTPAEASPTRSCRIRSLRLWRRSWITLRIPATRIPALDLGRAVLV
jgi:hypothetical protein